MLFNSFPFFLFLPTVFLLYWFAFKGSLKKQNLLLLVSSYFFYGWWSWQFMCLLALSTFLDYMYGFSVVSTDRRKAKLFLWLSVINNLGILGVFKYYNFFAAQISAGLAALGLHVTPVLLDVALPVGISFYTFHGMSYVFDIYRGKQEPVRNFVEYAVFVAFFPLLVAGPIERANHLLPQVQTTRAFDRVRAIQGCRLILWGLFKKVVIADNIADYVNDVFTNYPEYNGITIVSGAVAFAFQIYGDFSGYSDVAIGTAKLFGFELLSNFRFPYFSRDVAEFWRRWHISLSSWFRDYLYIPLGGSRNGKGRAVVNTFIIFLVSGFWHGAKWTFIVWGLIHAVGFIPLLVTGRNRNNLHSVTAHGRLLPGVKDMFQMLGTFLFVTLAWIFFRAESVAKAWDMLRRTVTSTGPITNHIIVRSKPVFYLIALLLVIDWRFRHDERDLRMTGNKFVNRLLYWIAATFILFNMINSEHQQFIYFQF